MKNAKWYTYLTPFLFAIFPVLSLARANLEYVQFGSIFRSLLIAALVALLLFLIFNFFLKDHEKSGILAGALVFIFLTYGNLYLFLEEQFSKPVDHRILLAALVVLYLAISVYLIRGVKDAKDINLAILTGGIVIVSYLLFGIGSYEVQAYRSEKASGGSGNALAASLTQDDPTEFPDIYLILLDGHTRSDLLLNEYGYDNSPFANQLGDLGFWVAPCSHSNYPSTTLSLTTMFEMDYLHHVYDEYDNLVLPPLNNTAVFQILSDHQYTTVTFHNFFSDHFEIKDDIRFSKEEDIFGSINEFEKEVVDTSILRVIVDMEDVFPYAWALPFEDNYQLTNYRDTLYTLDTLPDIPNLDGRKFVYAHLLVTHDPFVFMPDGSFNISENFTAADYVNSVDYIDTILPRIVEEIIQKSDQPPIIIVMGDHGPTVKGTQIEDRMKNLFAIYLQGKDPAALGFYEDISPVNVFRLIFNEMFDANFELMDEISYEIWNVPDLENLSKKVFPDCQP